MKIAVLGCGAIGGLFLGYLWPETDIFGVVKEYQRQPLEKEGLTIESSRGLHKAWFEAGLRLREPVDLAVFATKINNLEEAYQANKNYLKKATVVSVQNGVEAERVLKKFFPEDRIISSIVMFGSTFYPPNRIVYNFEGDLILGNYFQKQAFYLDQAKEAFSRAFSVKKAKNIKGAKYLKLFINLNNCLPAVLGKSMQEVFSDLDIACLAVDLNKEAYRVISEAGISLESLPSYPKERIEKLVSGPCRESAKIFSQIMSGLSKEPLYGSILQSIKRGKPSEIDYINGEIVSLAKESGRQAPLNEKIVELVHGAEEGKFLSKDELFTYLKNI